MDICNQLIKNTTEYFNNNFDCIPIDNSKNSFSLITPFVNNLGDYIELEVKITNDEDLVISDSGNTLDELFLFGIDLRESKDKYEKIMRLSNHFKVNFINSEFVVNAKLPEVGRRLFELIEVLKATYNLTYSITPAYIKDFREEVANFFVTKEIKFQRNIEIKGVSGNIKLFDFEINTKKEKIIKAISAKKFPRARDLIKVSHSDFIDILPIRKEILPIVIYDDVYAPDVWDRAKEEDLFNILEKNNIYYFGLYNEKDKILEKVA